MTLAFYHLVKSNTSPQAAIVVNAQTTSGMLHSARASPNKTEHANMLSTSKVSWQSLITYRSLAPDVRPLNKRTEVSRHVVDRHAAYTVKLQIALRKSHTTCKHTKSAWRWWEPRQDVNCSTYQELSILQEWSLKNQVRKCSLHSARWQSSQCSHHGAGGFT